MQESNYVSSERLKSSFLVLFPYRVMQIGCLMFGGYQTMLLCQVRETYTLLSVYTFFQLGSRDSTMAAWDVSVYRHESESQTTSLAEETRPIGPAFRFSNIQAQLHGTEGEKVRSLAFDPRGCVSIIAFSSPIFIAPFFLLCYML